jgi:signal transduction histidine kinase/DNA-binding response OmpR family regulator
MDRPLRKRLINFIFIMALLAMITSNILSYIQVKHQSQANRMIIHSYKVIQKINDILYDITDSARLQETYLYTNTLPYLLGARTTMQKAVNDANILKDLTKDNPSQQQYAINLAGYVVRTADLLDTVEGAAGNAPKITEITDKEHVLLNKFRTTTGTMISREESVLDERNEKALSESYQGNYLLIVTALLSDFFIIACFFLLSYQEQKYIKEQLRINHELEEKNKVAHEATRLKSEFLANMSHELRTPLNAVIGFSELMQDGVAGPVTKEQTEFLGDILSSAKHLLRLINDVLDLSKVEAGKMSFHPEVINLRNLVNEVVAILHPMIERKKINFTAIVDNDLSIAYLDPARLKQIIYNYLSNALKFTPELGSVKIHIKPDSLTTLRIEVEDNGIGIKTEDMQRLFVEFEQLDSSVTKKYAGTGLGLALTKRIVQAQGGQVGVTSIPGKGSIFFAILPLTQRTEVEMETGTGSLKAVPLTAASPVRIQNVLVIDDNQNDLEWMVNILTLNGYAVETAQTGKAALAHCENTIYDLITLDLMLPDMNGYEILRNIRLGINIDTPVVVITASGDRNQSMGFLVRDYLMKPVGKDKLLEALSNVGSPPHKNRKILAVDDDHHALKLITRLLDNQGYDLTCVENAVDALTYAEKHLPDVLILDLMMPGVSGFEFIRQLRDRGYVKDIPIVVWTAKELTKEERSFLEGSVQGIVLKSLADSTEKLLHEIKNLTTK